MQEFGNYFFSFFFPLFEKLILMHVFVGFNQKTNFVSSTYIPVVNATLQQKALVFKTKTIFLNLQHHMKLVK